MNAQLNSILAQQHIADRQRAAEHARLVTGAGTRRRDSRDSYPIVRALPMPTAHPSPEAWPAASLPAGTSPAPGRGARARSALRRTSTEHTLSTGARTKAAWVPLTRDQEARRSQGARERLRPAFVPGHGDELGSMAFSQPQTAPACFERSEQLAGVVHELLDAHAETEHLSRTQHSELWWDAHLRDLGHMQRVAPEVLADVS